MLPSLELVSLCSPEALVRGRDLDMIGRVLLLVTHRSALGWLGLD